VNEFVVAVRNGLAAAADPARAPTMQRYMKSEMPFLGVQKPKCIQVTRSALMEHRVMSRDEWIDTVLLLWRTATYREERYAALDLAARYPQWRDPTLMPVYDELVVTGAWWDYVDEIASRCIGPLLRAYTADIVPLMRNWSTDPDRWRRRVSIICQLGSKDAVDLELLRDTIEANISAQDFFLRKAIGWALRQHARVDPAWVRAFVDSHPELSPLSKREALKYL
jgi:3-methyladenine DNA glycosylase AlkD